MPVLSLNDLERFLLIRFLRESVGLDDRNAGRRALRLYKALDAAGWDAHLQTVRDDAEDEYAGLSEGVTTTPSKRREHFRPCIDPGTGRGISVGEQAANAWINALGPGDVRADREFAEDDLRWLKGKLSEWERRAGQGGIPMALAATWIPLLDRIDSALDEKPAD